jgi:Tol biopolymer transport system component
MKLKKALTIFILFFMGATVLLLGSIQQETAKELLEKAIYFEDTRGDLSGAIEIYNEILDNFAQNSEVAAGALYRLGLCHERLGNQEARKAYSRIIDEYPRQKEEVALAKARLAELDARAANVSRKPTFRKIRIPANPGNGVLSPDGRKFAFASEGSIWVLPIPGHVDPDLSGEPVRLTTPIDAVNVGNAHMAWSGDGKWIAFNVWNKEGLGLYVVSSEGGVLTKIAVSRGGGNNISPRISLSKDGRRLVFSSVDNQASAADPTDISYFLYTVPVGGGTASRLTDFWAHQPAFSPDGKKIAFARITASNYSNTKQDLWIINSDGRAPLRLTDLPGYARGPIWSPDARLIAFNFERAGDQRSKEICIIRVPEDGNAPGEPSLIELPSYSTSMLAGWTTNNSIGILMANPRHHAVYTVPATGGKAMQVTPEPQDIFGPCYPKWSTDGRTIFLRWGFGSIASIPAQGGKLSVVHDAQETEIVSALPGMGNGISPDGKTIVFTGGKRGGQPIEVGIWTVPVSGGKPKQIIQSPSPTQNRYPCWSPDGKSVAFLRYKPGPAPIPQIFVASSSGEAARQMTSDNNKVGLGSIDWSPDGKTIAYFSRDNTINLIPAAGGEHKVLLDLGRFNRNWFSDLAWSPDGNELAYTAADQLMVLSLKSGQTREVQTGVLGKGVQDFYIDWSPDGSKLAFSAAHGGDEELWLMEDFLHLVKNSE